MNFPAIFFGAALALSPNAAFAHWGHVGELAGHGHVIAIGAAAAAAALAAALLKPDRQSDDDTVEADEEDIPNPEMDAA